MPVTIKELERGASVEIFAAGKRHKTDYTRFASLARALVLKHGSVRILFVMHDFHSWNTATLWKDIGVDFPGLVSEIERIAFTGDPRWKPWMEQSFGSFSSARVRYFDRDHEDRSRAWLRAGR